MEFPGRGSVLVLTALCLGGPLAAQEPVGYQASIPAKLLTEADLQRMVALPMQDLLDRSDGRYQALSNDGVMGHWGLDQLVVRQDVSSKPYGLLRDSSGSYQTERVIFADLSTGVPMFKLTNQPYSDGGDELIYFGKSCWSADGARAVWSRVSSPSLWGPGSQNITEQYGPMLVNGDGTGMQIAFSQRSSMGAVLAHPTVPNRAYAPSQGEIVELDLQTGQVVGVLPTDPNPPHWHMKMSPDGKYVCDTSYSTYTRGIVVVSLEDPTQQWTVPLSGRIHDSYRFVPGDTDWIMFWYEGGFPPIQMVNFKTGESNTASDVRFDWNHGDVGRYLGVHTGGQIFPYNSGVWSLDTNITWPDRTFVDSGPYYDLHFQFGGYLQHWPDDQLWAYPTHYYTRPLLSEIGQFFAKPFVAGGRANRFRLCHTNLWRSQDRTGAETVVLDRPNISRDGTKILFNSNVFSRSSVYMVVANKPRPPVAVSASWTGAGVELTWDHPRYHQEISGYRVYRSTTSGHGMELLVATPVGGLSYTDATAQPNTVYFYALRSVEHSRLESELSAEVSASSNSSLQQSADQRIFVEAESAISAELAATPPDSLWLQVDGTASDLHYIWQRRSDQAGSLSVDLAVPRAADYWIFARLKGETGSNFDIAGRTVSAASSGQWQWVRSSQPVSLAAGQQNIGIASNTYGSCLDAFYLSTDADFEPRGRVTTTEPETLQLSVTVEQGLPKLSWPLSQHPRFYYYNLYCVQETGDLPSQHNLIASPDKPDFLDWQTVGDCAYYKLTQVTLDGLQSTPSTAPNPLVSQGDGGISDSSLGVDSSVIADASGGADASVVDAVVLADTGSAADSAVGADLGAVSDSSSLDNAGAGDVAVADSPLSPDGVLAADAGDVTGGDSSGDYQISEGCRCSAPAKADAGWLVGLVFGFWVLRRVRQ